ncbi:3-ketoacyl-CoA thiolase B, peroxisomal [Patella vulgata]|uniref:3-ketoacyl-CoA thiolase B, peroxisomal n=1 Tax=Patella vulgata TaxID=6465 RepID=UPI00217FFD2A|nr:3-ketoacyl-CoA thiolase B, peroxisomal [Patella vulgata]
MDRLRVLSGHVISRNLHEWQIDHNPTAANNSPEDIVIVSALRTPIGKAKRGSFKDTYPDDLLAAVFKAVIADVNVSPSDIGDICIGNVGDSRAAVTARFAQFYSGIPETVPIFTTNRQCSSGLQAVLNVAGSIRNGVCNVGLAGGFESMTLQNNNTKDINPRVFEVEKARDCLIPMGITSENVAKRFGVSRLKQDQFSVESQRRANEAQRNGLFKAEIVPVTTTIKDKAGNEQTITVSDDCQ